jgi:hypothetical protein
MAVQLLQPGDPRWPTDVVPQPDIIARQQAEHRAKDYPKAVFKNEVVKIDFGTKGNKEEVMLRYEAGSTFVFAVYQDNPDWHERGREEWSAAASDALEKFIAMRDAQIVAGPRPEITNRYNLFVETRGGVA